MWNKDGHGRRGTDHSNDFLFEDSWPDHWRVWSLIGEPLNSYFHYLFVAQCSRFWFRRRCKYHDEHVLESDEQMCFTKHGHVDSMPHFTTGDGRRTLPAKICDTHLNTRSPHIHPSWHLSPCSFSIFQPYWLGAVSVGSIRGLPVGFATETMLLGGEQGECAKRLLVLDMKW